MPSCLSVRMPVAMAALLTSVTGARVCTSRFVAVSATRQRNRLAVACRDAGAGVRSCCDKQRRGSVWLDQIGTACVRTCDMTLLYYVGDDALE